MEAFMSSELLQLILDVIEDKLGEEASMTYYEYTEDRDYMCWISPVEGKEGVYYAGTDMDDMSVTFKSKGKTTKAIEKDAVKDLKVKKHFLEYALDWVERNEEFFNELTNESGDKLPVISQIYVKKGSKREDYEDFVIVDEVGNGKVSFSNPFHDTFKLSVDEFNKKYVKGKKPDYEMFEEMKATKGMVGKILRINESEYPVVSEGSNRVVCVSEEGEKFVLSKDDIVESVEESADLSEAGTLSVVNKGVDSKGLLLIVNGKDYHYTSDSMTPKELEDKYLGIAKHSIGKAFAWIRKNAKAKESYKKDKAS